MDKKFKRYKVDYAAAYRHYIDFCLWFDDIYESINADWLEEEKDKIQQCVEVMLDALRDMEMKAPATFQKIVSKIIKM